MHLLNEDKFIDVKALGKIIFTDIHKLQQFNILMYNPMLLRIRRALYGKKGIILLDSALIAETGMTRLCNNNVILVKTSTEIQRRRLLERNYSEAQISGRIASQLTFELKKSFIQKEILKNDYGTLLEFDNNNPAEIKSLYEKLESMMGVKYQMTDDR
jgi:dephospho-CoA kinase